MRLANSLINKRYLLFKSKQILPYVIIMTVVGVAVTFVMNLCLVPSSYNDLNHIIVDGHLIFPGWAFMYVYPVLLSLSLFSFMHKKNASDLFAAAPVTKKEYYLTNMLIALIYSAAMILIMMLSSILTVNLLNSTEIPQTVAFDAFIKIFLFLLLGFMQVYTITSTAATLTGTVPAQLFTAAVMLLSPTAIFMLFQFPTIADIDTTFSTTTNLGETYLAIYGKTANDFIYPLNIGTSPISILAALLSSNITESHGLITHFTDAPAMIYTLAIIVVYAIAGIEIFTKYKMENVERPFVNEKFGLIMRALIFLPVISLLVTLFHNDGSIFNEIFITLFVVITVAYIVADLILRKGIKGLSKSLGTYAIICVMSVIFGATLGYIMEVNNDADPTLINKDDITKVTVYMEPLNMTPYEEENIKKYYIPIDLTDENIIENIVGTPNEKDYGNSFWFEIKAGNKTYFAKKRLTQDATNLIFRYIDDNPEIKKSLMINTGMSNHVKSDIMLIYSNSSVNTNKNYMKTLTKRSEIRDIRKDFEAALLETPCVEIYSAKRSIDDAFIRNRWIESNGNSIGDNNSQIVMNEIKYHDGMYYLSSSELAYGSEAFEKIISDMEQFAELAKRTNEITQDQRVALEQVDAGIEQISSVTQQNATASEETSTLSDELAAQATELNMLVSHFQLEA